MITASEKGDALTPVAPPERTAATLHLSYLDGLRGLAAVYVVLYHIWLEVTTRPDAAMLPSYFHLLGWLGWGSYSVDVFIVLSGYCLMLPVVRSQDGQLRGGVFAYLARRARRILPPYYAALGLSLLLIALFPGLERGIGTNWDFSVPAFAFGPILSHLLLVQNLRPEWIFKINGPLWSVATEWQIYFFFPLLLLPVWRRLGTAAAVAAAFIVGYSLNLNFLHLKCAALLLLGLFALGMAGAILNFSPAAQRAWSNRVSWTGLAFVFGLLVVVVSGVKPEWAEYHLAPLVGAAAACALVGWTQTLQRECRRPPVLRLLSSRSAVALGRFSYSLYLIHYPLLAVFHLFLRQRHVGPLLSFELLMSVGLTLILSLAYGFHCLFERPFMTSLPFQNPMKQWVKALKKS